MRSTAVVILISVLLPLAAAHAADSKGSDPFKDLPGVKADDKKDMKFEAACTPEIRNSRYWDDDFRRGRRTMAMPERVYVCNDGDVTFESTRTPQEYDWDVYKKRQ